MWEAQCVARLSRRDHGLGRAAGALRVRTVRVEPQAKRHADRVRAGPEERDGAIDPAAHRDGGPARRRCGAEDRPERGRERVGGERLARHGRRLEQRKPFERPLEAGRIRLDDAITLHREPHERPLAVAGRVSGDLDHPPRLAPKKKPHRCRCPRAVRTWTCQVGALPASAGLAPIRTQAPFTYVLVQT